LLGVKVPDDDAAAASSIQGRRWRVIVGVTEDLIAFAPRQPVGKEAEPREVGPRRAISSG